MKAHAYEMLAAREGSYWWHRARRVMVRNLLRKYGLADQPRWLYLGCGPGGNLALLDEFSPELVVGADISPGNKSLFRREARIRMCGNGRVNRIAPRDFLVLIPESPTVM